MNKLIWVSVLSLLSSEVLNAHKEEEDKGAASASVSAKVKVNGVELLPEAVAALKSAIEAYEALPEGQRPVTLTVKITPQENYYEALDGAFFKHRVNRRFVTNIDRELRGKINLNGSPYGFTMECGHPYYIYTFNLSIIDECRSLGLLNK